MNEKFYGTKEVAKILNVNVSTLGAAMWRGAFDEPEKVGGRYLWRESDIQRAGRALLHRSFKRLSNE